MKKKAGNAIKALLVAEGIKQSDIATELGISKATVSKVVSGKTTSRRVKSAIVNHIGPWVEVELLWPSRKGEEDKA